MTAALILTWIAMALLAVGMAGMVRQLRDVQAKLRGVDTDHEAHHEDGDDADDDPVEPAPEQLWPEGDARLAVVLLADESCPDCAELAPLLPELAEEAPAGVDVVLLASSPSEKWSMPHGARVRVVVDADTMHQADPGWRPALLAVNHVGEVVMAEPVDGPAQIRGLVEDFVDAQLETARNGE